MKEFISPNNEQKKQNISDDDLIALGRSICWDIREELSAAIVEEDNETIAEPKPGQLVKYIDLACNKRARRVVSKWEKKHNCRVHLTGEDIAPVAPSSELSEVICCLDSLDGTQHWLGRRNLYCTAITFLLQDENDRSDYHLRVSVIQNAAGTIYIAREDKAAAFIDGQDKPLSISFNKSFSLSNAQVCTVCRRPGHYKVLVKHLRNGSPFSGLYSFGGNPILAELATGYYDAVFQPNAFDTNDNPPLWDWLPGGHIAQRSGCYITDINGNEMILPDLAKEYLQKKDINIAYIAAKNLELAKEIANWLRFST
jgi:fructose-1,6-bisphosphatase/inositol monophosphatase family enzyme